MSRNSESGDSVIDLTDADSSYTLANHFRLNDLIVNLDTDDSFNVSDNVNVRIYGRKRLKKTRGTVDPETCPVHDLCTPTPENKNKKRKSKRISENSSIVIQEPTGEPVAKKAKKQNAFCPICFEEFNDQALASTSCGHVFCLKCIKLALKKKSRCPTCRTILKGSSKFHPIFL